MNDPTPARRYLINDVARELAATECVWDDALGRWRRPREAEVARISSLVVQRFYREVR